MVKFGKITCARVFEMGSRSAVLNQGVRSSLQSASEGRPRERIGSGVCLLPLQSNPRSVGV